METVQTKADLDGLATKEEQRLWNDRDFWDQIVYCEPDIPVTEAIRRADALLEARRERFPL